MADIITRLAEARIEEAVRKGELNDLAGQGKPLALWDLNPFVTPEERMHNMLLKNMGLLPIEIWLLKETDRLSGQLAECADPIRHHQQLQRLDELKMTYRIRMETRKKGNRLL